MTHYHVFADEPAGLRTVGGVIEGVLRGDSASIIQLGVLLLIATPVARVLHVRDRIRKRARLDVRRDARCIVLAILVYSLAHGG